MNNNPRSIKLAKCINILREACQRNGVVFQLLDLNLGLCRISTEGKHLHMLADSMIYNPNYAVKLAASKVCSQVLLESAQIKTPQTRVCHLDTLSLSDGEIGEELCELLAWTDVLGYPVFVKPDKGSLGRLARRVANSSELIRHLRTIKKYFGAAIVQECLSYDEYRIVAIQGEPIFAHRRRIGRILGNGVHTFTELFADYCRKNPATDPVNGINHDLILSQLVSIRGTWQSVLPVGIEIRLSDAANTSNGGCMDEIQYDNFTACRPWVNTICQLFRLTVCGIDLFAPMGLQAPEHFIAIEVNSNPGLDGELAISIWQKLLLSAFEPPFGQET